MRYLVPLFLLLLIGCGGEPKIEAKQPITLEEVPANLMKIAHEKLPDVKFDRAWKQANGVYEINGKNKNGKVREIDLRPDGSIVEIE